MKFLSVCASKLRKLLRVEVKEDRSSTEEYSLRCELYRVQAELTNKELEIAQLRRAIEVQNFEMEAIEQVQANQVPVWVMSPEMYKKFCASFEPPIVNAQSSDHEAAFKLGIQRVLSRIGEQYVSR